MSTILFGALHPLRHLHPVACALCAPFVGLLSAFLCCGCAGREPSGASGWIATGAECKTRGVFWHLDADGDCIVVIRWWWWFGKREVSDISHVRVCTLTWEWWLRVGPSATVQQCSTTHLQTAYLDCLLQGLRPRHYYCCYCYYYPYTVCLGKLEAPRPACLFEGVTSSTCIELSEGKAEIANHSRCA